MKPSPLTPVRSLYRIRQQARSLAERAPRLTTLQIAIVAFCLGGLITLCYRPFTQIVFGDPAFYDYIAQSILRGQLPYRDTVDIKFPGAAYLSALAMAIGHLVGLRDVLAVRALYVLMVGLFSALIFLVARDYLRSRAAGVIAFLIPLTLTHFGEFMTSGTEPKLPLLICGLLSLVMVARDRPFWAGFCGMLACLFWQPGLMFAGAAGLIFSRYLTNWRDLRAFKVIVGAALPLALVLLYFYYKGALGDLWAWTITYNYSVFGPDAERSLLKAAIHIWVIAERVFGYATVLVPLSIIGFAGFSFGRLKSKRHLRAALRSPDLYRDALLMPPLVYFAFSLMNFQAGPDLLPFLPFIAIFAGYFFVKAGRWLASRRFMSARWPQVQWAMHLPAAAISILLLAALVSSAVYRRPRWTLHHQDELFKPIADALGTDGKVYVHGMPELLVVLNRPNLNPYLFLDWGADEFAAQRRGVLFSQLVAEMEAQTPAVVALSRLKAVRHRDDYRNWVEQHYTPLEIPGYDGIYVRKP